MKIVLRFFEIVRGLVLELSDEAGYRRHLAGRASSAAAWREFSDRRYRGKYQNTKCC